MQGQAYSECSDSGETQANPEGKLLLQLLIDAKTLWEYQQQAYDWVQQMA
jgi:hypothetical protein